MLREDPSRAAHPGPAGQGRAQHEAGGRPLAATVGDAAAVSWLLFFSIPPLLIPVPLPGFRRLQPERRGQTSGAGMLPKRPAPYRHPSLVAFRFACLERAERLARFPASIRRIRTFDVSDHQRGLLAVYLAKGFHEGYTMQ